MTEPVDPYDTFAAVYDLPAHGEIAAAFVRAVRPYIDALPEESCVLDVGCGTGKVSELLAHDGFRVFGVDRSDAMLEIARRRCEPFGDRVQFACDDLTTFEPHQTWPLALACGEIVNHFPSLDLVRKMFRRLADCLPSNGKFVFETLNRFCFEAYWDDLTYFYPGERGDVVMECSWEPETGCGTAHIISFAKQHQHYVKTETILQEYWHDENALRSALLQCGFREVRARSWTPWPLEMDDEHKDRTFWEAVK